MKIPDCQIGVRSRSVRSVATWNLGAIIVVTLGKVMAWCRGMERGSESEVAQSCLTLCDPVDCSLPGSSVHGILQARVLEWVAISFSSDLSDPGIKPRSSTLQADAFVSELLGKPGGWKGEERVLTGEWSSGKGHRTCSLTRQGKKRD